jgi:glycosyltransferase involved in cell wall biosynthesis
MSSVVIIPIYKQYKNIHLILEGITKQTVKPDKVIFAIDRVNSEDANELREVGLICKDRADLLFVPEYPSKLKRKDRGFYAGHVRNYAIQQVLDYDTIIIIDGDCVPQETLVEEHIKGGSHKHPIITIGRRREKKYSWRDQREVDKNLALLRVIRKKNYIVNSPYLIQSSAILWSCNISFNKEAIARLLKANSYLYNRTEIFNSDFNGEWGGEDGFLGIFAYRLGVHLQMLGSEDAGVMHIDHPRGDMHDSQQHLKYLDTKINELSEVLLRKPITIDFFNHTE